VIDTLSELFAMHGVPRHIRSDNGPDDGRGTSNAPALRVELGEKKCCQGHFWSVMILPLGLERGLEQEAWRHPLQGLTAGLFASASSGTAARSSQKCLNGIYQAAERAGNVTVRHFDALAANFSKDVVQPLREWRVDGVTVRMVNWGRLKRLRRGLAGVPIVATRCSSVRGSVSMSGSPPRRNGSRPS